MTYRMDGDIRPGLNIGFRQEFHNLLITGVDERSLPCSDTAAGPACQQSESHYVSEEGDRFINIVNPHAHVMDVDTSHADCLPKKIFHNRNGFGCEAS
jgi:hypothetical protein